MSAKIAIYSVIVGNYDAPKDPINLPEDFIWSCIRPSESDLESIGIKDSKMASVYYKTHPELLFPDSDYSLFLDGNITISDSRFYGIIRDLVEKGALYAGIKHPQRDDIFEESYRIIRNGRDSLCNTVQVTRFLKREGMPRHFGLTETNIILRKHSDPKIQEFDTLWWDTYNKYPKRDQMSQSYCIWKTGIHQDYILPENQNARTCPYLEYTMHGTDALPKDRSFSGRIKDAERALVKSLYRLYLKSINIHISDK